jgi:type IV secretion system protein VirD4
MVFDPTGTVELPPGVHRVGWSPVAAAEDWDGAHHVASVMVHTSRGQRPGASAGTDVHWTERAAALLGPLLHAAALEGTTMRRVVHWIDRHDGAPALDVLSRRCGEGAVPTDVLSGILSTDSREQSGIWSTASGVLAAYRSRAALASTDPPYLDADVFCRGRHTLYVCAPGADQQLVAPLVVGLISQIRDAAYRRAGRGVVDPPVLLALDEVANIAPLPDLPSIVTDGPGQGLLTLACLQDLSQARARWGPEAASFLSIFGTSAILGGIADAPTLELVSALAGEHEVVTRSVARSLGPRGHQHSSTAAAILRRRLPVDVVARGAPGWALTLDARNRVGWVRLTPAHRSELWGRLGRPERASPRIDRPSGRQR